MLDSQLPSENPCPPSTPPRCHPNLQKPLTPKVLRTNSDRSSQPSRVYCRLTISSPLDSDEDHILRPTNSRLDIPQSLAVAFTRCPSITTKGLSCSPLKGLSPPPKWHRSHSA